MYKVSKFKTIVFLIFSNLFLFISLTSDYALSKFNQNTWYTPIIIFLFFILLIMLLPKQTNHLMKRIYKNKMFKLFITIYVIVQNIILTYLGLAFFSNYVYTEIHFLFFIIVICIISYILGMTTFSNIISLSSVAFFVSMLFYLIPIMSNTDRYVLYIMPIVFDNPNLINIMAMAFIPIDTILILIYSNQIEPNLKIKDYFIFALLFFGLITFIYVDAFTLLSYKIYQEYNLSIFYHWQIYSDNKYISNFYFAIIYIMITSIIFKKSLNNNILKIYANKKILYFIPSIATILIYYSKLKLIDIINIFIYILIVLGVFLYIFLQHLLRSKNNERIN